MKEIDSDILKDKLKILLKIFESKPNLLAQYLVEYNILSEDFLSKLDKNKNIENQLNFYNQNNNIEKPLFSNLEEMQEYYNSLFEENKDDIKHPVLGVSTRTEMLIKQLKDAIKSENYDKAAKLRDYIKTLNINIENFF